MATGDTIARARSVPVTTYTDAAADIRAFNAYVAQLRQQTGFDLRVATLAPQVIGEDVIRCMTVTRRA